MTPRNFCHRLANRLRRLRTCSNGAAAAEFAVIVPIVGLVMAGTMDLAELGNQGATLDGAIRAGADYAMVDPTNRSAITSRITGYVAKWGGSTPVVTFPNGETDSTQSWYNQFCTCDGDSISAGTITCNNDESDGGKLCTSGPKHYYMTIQAVESGITPLVSGVLGNCSSDTGHFCITRKLTVRVQ